MILHKKLVATGGEGANTKEDAGEGWCRLSDPAES